MKEYDITLYRSTDKDAPVLCYQDGMLLEDEEEHGRQARYVFLDNPFFDDPFPLGTIGKLGLINIERRRNKRTEVAQAIIISNSNMGITVEISGEWAFASPNPNSMW